MCYIINTFFKSAVFQQALVSICNLLPNNNNNDVVTQKLISVWQKEHIDISRAEILK